MIVDVHTHYWLPRHQGDRWNSDVSRVSRTLASVDLAYVDPVNYLEGLGPAEKSIVFGLQADAAGIHVPNDEIAEFVQKCEGRAIGFMSIDPTDPNACEEIERSAQDLGLRGLKLGPVYQGTSPLDPLVLRVFSLAERLGLPVMIHQGAVFSNAGRLADSLPILLDDIAIAFPDLKIIVAHLGHPWFYDTAVVMRRHENVFADTSAIPSRPTVLAQALIATKEYGVFDKVLFGSDSPMVTTESAITKLIEVVQRTQEVGYTAITDEDLHNLLHRPSLDLLGLSGD